MLKILDWKLGNTQIQKVGFEHDITIWTWLVLEYIMKELENWDATVSVLKCPSKHKNDFWKVCLFEMLQYQF